MGKGIRYTDEFNQEAVNQVVVNGYAVNDVAELTGTSLSTVTHKKIRKKLSK